MEKKKKLPRATKKRAARAKRSSAKKVTVTGQSLRLAAKQADVLVRRTGQAYVEKATELGATEIGKAQVRLRQDGPPQVGPAEVAARQAGSRQVRLHQVGSLEVGLLEVGARQIGFGEVAAPEEESAQVTVAEVDPDQVGEQGDRELQALPLGEALPAVTTASSSCRETDTSAMETDVSFVRFRAILSLLYPEKLTTMV